MAAILTYMHQNGRSCSKCSAFNAYWYVLVSFTQGKLEKSKVENSKWPPFWGGPLFTETKSRKDTLPTTVIPSSFNADLMGAAKSRIIWSGILIIGMYWIGRLYGFLLLSSGETRNKRTCVAACRFFLNKFLKGKYFTLKKQTNASVCHWILF